MISNLIKDDSRIRLKDDESSLTAASSIEFISGSSSHSIDFLSPGASKLRGKKIVSEADQRLVPACDHSSSMLLENESIKSLTINKLRFDSVGVVGRETQNRELNSCFNRMLTTSADGKNNSCAKELVFIKGSSGSGKSKLARTMYSFPTHLKTGTKEISKNCIVGEGKFDFNDSEEPFSAVARAFDGLFKAVRVHEQESAIVVTRTEEISLGETLVNELGPATELLIRLMPELGDLLRDHHSMDFVVTEDAFKDETNFDAAKQQLASAFRILTRVLCKHFHNLILILDDLQWASVASLEVFDSLISDIQNHNGLMIIGCYRSDEVDASHLLHRRIQVLHDKKERQNFVITDIDLPPFPLEHVNEVLMRLMSIDDKNETESLAQLCLKRTMGNPHFLIEFVTMLMDEKLLDFNLGLLRWKWDESKIEELTMSTENVVELLQKRMEKLSSNEQLLLQYAACLGSSFQIDMLNLVWTSHTPENSSTQAKGTEKLIENLHQGHFIEPDGNSGKQYRWVHDKVQEAALALGRANEPSFQFEIGMTLYNGLDSEALEEALFDVVALINRGQVKRRADLASLNLRAAEKAKDMSAFSTASIFTSHGIALLPGDRWAPAHFALTLRLYVLGSQTALATGNFAKLEQCNEEVLSQPSATLLEKMPVYLAQLDQLCADQKYAEAIGISLKLLKELGFNMVPFRALLPIQAITVLIRTVRQAKVTSPEAFCQRQPLMEDPHSAIMLVLLKMGYAAFFCGDDFMFVLAITRGVQMTLKHGIHDHSASAFVFLGSMAKSVLGDFASAGQFVETAELMTERVPNHFNTASSIFSAYYFVLGWTTPLQSCFVPLLENYKNGLRAGNNEFAVWSLWAHHVSLAYQVGKPLGSILARCPEILNQTEELNLNEHSFHVRLYWQLVYNLAGKANDEPMKLKGDIFDCDKDGLDIPLHSARVKYVKMELLLFYGDYEGAAEIAIEQGDRFENDARGCCETMIETCHRAISCYAAFQQTKRRKYRKQAQRIRKKIARWKKKNIPNVVHYAAFLDAETAAVEKRYADAEEGYKKSIIMAARPGYLHDAALFNERYMHFLLRNRDHVEAPEEELRYRLKEGLRYYREWGALLKVEMMKKDWVEFCD